MGQPLTNQEKVLVHYYEHPQERFTVRALAKSTGIPKSTVQTILQHLKKNNVLTENLSINETQLFRKRKIHYYIEQLYDVGLMDALQTHYAPSCIILFGSVRKGESDAESDIDLFVESTQNKPLDVKKYEYQLKRHIDLHVHQELNKVPELLRNNIINGIKLEGAFRCAHHQAGKNAKDDSSKK